MSSTLTSSANLLGACSNAYQPVFSPLLIHDTLYYDEGPRQTYNPTTVQSSSMSNLSSSYPFVQGVEITRQSMYVAGLVKIWSGDAGHVLKTCVFGQSKDPNILPNSPFVDDDFFNPVVLLQTQQSDPTLSSYFNLTTTPIIIENNTKVNKFNLNGIIEPLTIRTLDAFSSIKTSLESHATRGAFGSGNTNQVNGSDVIQTVSDFEPHRHCVSFIDTTNYVSVMSSSVGVTSAATSINDHLRYEFTAVVPFTDQRLIRNMPAATGSIETTMVHAMSEMTGAGADNYLRFNQVSAPCGWYYDNNANVGTDSIAFGGMTY